MGQPKNSPKKMRLKQGKAGAEVARVLAILDGREILEHTDFVARNPLDGERKYYVKNISYSAIETDLRELFESIGRVSECHIFRDYSGKSRGFAVLRIVGDALVLNGQMFEGRELEIEPWVET